MLGAFVSFALLDLWEESMQTLALMGAAVLISILIGVPVGVYAGRNQRFHRAITPVGAMQIVPAFAYLMPVVIIFSVGPCGRRDLHAHLRIRLRSHHRARHPRRDGGVGGASRAFGATNTRPCSRCSSRSRVASSCSRNQTIMFALSWS